MTSLGLGLREGLMLALALAVVYFVVMLLRLIQLGRRRGQAARSPDPLEPAAGGYATVSPLRQRSEPKAAAGSGESAAQGRPKGFGEHLADHLARSEVEMEVQRMRDEMARMRAEVAALRNARRVSPQYAEAMDMAQRGSSAQDIADRLGLALAEAELICALSRGNGDFAAGVKDDGEDNHAGSIDGYGRDERGPTG